jgi:hypothetical protein
LEEGGGSHIEDDRVQRDFYTRRFHVSESSSTFLVGDDEVQLRLLDESVRCVQRVSYRNASELRKIEGGVGRVVLYDIVIDTVYYLL